MHVPTRWLAMAAALLLSSPATAAGIDCDLAMSESEQAICADPVLKQLDDRLAAAWTRERADRDVAEALTADQQRWLRERDACGARLTCLRPIYARRLAELDETTAPFRWPGTWTRIGGRGDTGSLRIDDATKGHYRVSLDASAGANSGSLEGDASGPGPDSLTLAAMADAPRCRIVLHRVGRFVDIEQNEDSCGAGNGVSFAGRYVPGDAAREPVQWTLLTLGVVVQAQDDAALRALLGAKDYDALVETADEIQDGREADQLGANVTQLAVRGLYTLQEALLMQAPEGRLWVALLGFDARKQPQLRYYSNVAEWTDRLPATVEAWRKRFADVPVRMMSAPGQPIRNTTATHD